MARDLDPRLIHPPPTGSTTLSNYSLDGHPTIFSASGP
jgi:hypothetical protein